MRRWAAKPPGIFLANTQLTLMFENISWLICGGKIELTDLHGQQAQPSPNSRATAIYDVTIVAHPKGLREYSFARCSPFQASGSDSPPRPQHWDAALRRIVPCLLSPNRSNTLHGRFRHRHDSLLTYRNTCFNLFRFKDPRPGRRRKRVAHAARRRGVRSSKPREPFAL